MINGTLAKKDGSNYFVIFFRFSKYDSMKIFREIDFFSGPPFDI